ncbi:hypothetical protein TSUD_27860 [Trifolium subterraneum]|uniref:Uncharacterized protein n=1 Tax=Trifolium subterraneum TaxID=3900 RepID=A0A2Z6NGM3_TRISU|nr:hypothetical protein TSUD_27860 [Trifolium subterraneum]
MDSVLLQQESTVEGGMQKHVEVVDDLKSSDEKRVERGKGVKSKRKRVERGKGLKSDTQRERKRVEYNRRMSENEYLKIARKLGPFDAIPGPPNSLRAGNLIPLNITDNIRPLLIELSEIALEKYNDDNNQVLN